MRKLREQFRTVVALQLVLQIVLLGLASVSPEIHHSVIHGENILHLHSNGGATPASSHDCDGDDNDAPENPGEKSSCQGDLCLVSLFNHGVVLSESLCGFSGERESAIENVILFQSTSLSQFEAGSVQARAPPLISCL